MNTENIKVSIIIPIHNQGIYLEKCLNSIINQTFKDIEIICINNDSIDNSLEIIEFFAKDDPRIKIINSPNNGEYYSRNIGLKVARGEYITFLNASDFLMEDFIEKSYLKSNNYDLDILMCKSLVLNEKNQNKENDSWHYEMKWMDEFYKNIFNHTNMEESTFNLAPTHFNKIYKKEFLINNNINFPEHLRFSEEFFFYKSFLNAKKTSIIKENLCVHLMNKLEIKEKLKISTSDTSNLSREFFLNNEKILNQLSENNKKLKNEKLEDIVSVSRKILNLFIELNYFNVYKKFIIKRLLHLILQKFSDCSEKYRESFYYAIKDFFNDFNLNSFNKYYLDSNILPRISKIANSNTYEEFLKQDKNKEFSIITAVYNSQTFLREYFERLFDQYFWFESNVELIIVDDGSIDNSKKICLEYQKKFPNNIQFIEQKHAGVSAARNTGLKYASGKYINFIDSDDKFKKNTLKEVYEFFKEAGNKTDVVSIPMFFFDGSHGKHALNDKFDRNKIIDLYEEPNTVQISTSSSFINRKSIKDIKFNEKQIDLEDGIFINKILLNKGTLGIINTTNYEYRKRKDNSAILDNSHKMKEQFNNISYFKDLISFSKKENNLKTPEFIQKFILFNLENILENENIEEILNPNEIIELHNELNILLNDIDDNIITNPKFFNQKYIKPLLRFKYNYSNIKIENQKVVLNSDSLLTEKLGINKLIIDSLDFKKRSFTFLLKINSFLDINKINIELLSDKNKIINGINIEKTEGTLHKYLGKNINDFNLIKIKIPSKNKKVNFKFNFTYFDKNVDFDKSLSNHDFNKDIFITTQNNIISLNKEKHEYKLSIIVPVNNGEKYLPKCLDSICNQKLKDFEVLCINENSRDNSLNILEKYAKKDKRIKIISTKNENQIKSRNIGINKSKGEYVSFVNSTDCISPNMFKKLYDNSYDNDLDINIGKISVFDEKNDEYLTYDNLDSFNYLKKSIFNHINTKKFTCDISKTPVNKIYKRNFLINNQITFPKTPILAEEIFFYETYLKSYKNSITKDAIYYYHLNGEKSFLKNEYNKNTDIKEVYDLLENILIETNSFEIYKNSIFNKFMHAILNRFFELPYEFRENYFNDIKYFLNNINLTKDVFDKINFQSENLKNIKNFDRDLLEMVHNLDLYSLTALKKIVLSNNYDKFKEINKNKEFSIIIAIYNTEKYLEESIKSIINQDIGFENNVELILIDDGSTDNSKDICLKYEKLFPNNVKYIYQKNQGQATARNNGMEIAKGKYLNFLDSDDKLQLNALKTVYNFFENNYEDVDVVSIPIKFFDRTTGEHVLNYKYSSTRVIDLFKEPNNPQLSASASFIKKEAIKNNIFDTELVLSEDAIFLNKILLEKNKLGVVHETSYKYRKRFNQGSTIDLSIKNKDYFLHRSEAFFKELMNYSKNKLGEIPQYIQFTIMYDLQWMLRIEEIDDVLNENEKIELYNHLYDIFQNIDDEIILKEKHGNSPLKLTAFCFKYGNLHTDILNKNIIRKLAGYKVIDILNIHRIYIDSIDIKNNTLNILGFFKSFFNSSEINIQGVKYNKKLFLKEWVEYFNAHKMMFINNDYLTLDGLNIKNNLNIGKYSFESFKNLNSFLNFKNINLNKYFNLNEINDIFLTNDIVDVKKYDEIYNKKLNEFIDKTGKSFHSMKINYPQRDKKHLGLELNKTYNFDLAIPLEKKENTDIKLKVNYRKLNIYLDIYLQKYVKLSAESYYSKKENHLIEFENNSFKITPYSMMKLLKLERKNINNLNPKEKYCDEAIKLRNRYYLLYPFIKNREIWLFMDRHDFADDNAEHLYKYAINQKDDIKKYFILSKKSKDYERLKKLPNMVDYGSKKHKMLYLLADKIISSHPDEDILNPFWNNGEKYYSGLITLDKYFIQHGIILHDVSTWLHKYDKNLSLITTSSLKEYDSFFKHPYNYSKDVIKLLGLPRYDNLKNDNLKNQIIITPTWRKEFQRISKEEFEETLYYKIFNSLIKNKELIKIAEKYNYTIIFRPHPNVYPFIDLFKENKCVKIDFDSTYQELFNQSKLMITDYSSVAFDFAYMQKPILYYQFPNDNFQYDLGDSYFDYDTMGFGEILENENELIDKIKKHISNDCKMNEIYKNRVENFYMYNDKKNCKRVYEAIYKEK